MATSSPTPPAPTPFQRCSCKAAEARVVGLGSRLGCVCAYVCVGVCVCLCVYVCCVYVCLCVCIVCVCVCVCVCMLCVCVCVCVCVLCVILLVPGCLGTCHRWPVMTVWVSEPEVAVCPGWNGARGARPTSARRAREFPTARVAPSALPQVPWLPRHTCLELLGQCWRRHPGVCRGRVHPWCPRNLPGCVQRGPTPRQGAAPPPPHPPPLRTHQPFIRYRCPCVPQCIMGAVSTVRLLAVAAHVLTAPAGVGPCIGQVTSSGSCQ